MAKKKNPMLAQIEAAYEVKMARMMAFVHQQCEDILQIAAGEYGMNQKQVHDFVNLYREISMEYADTCIMDSKGDKELWYTWANLDERLQAATGEWFVPREERYK